MISQGCVVKKSCDSMDDFLKFQVLWCLSKFHVHRPCQRGCVTLLLCHVTTHHQVVRGSCNSIVGFFSRQVPNLPCLRKERYKFSIFPVTSRDHVIRRLLWVSCPGHKPSLCQVWWPLALQKRRYFAFDLSLDLMWLRDQRVMWHCGRVSLIVNLHPAKFGGHRQGKTFRFSFATWLQVNSASESHVTLWVSFPCH